MDKIVTDGLKPTYENVSKFFILTSMNEIILNKHMANFYIDFKEKEAIDFIKEEIKNELERLDKRYSNKLSDVFKKRYNKLLSRLKNVSRNNTKKPVMVIRDYKKFFTLLTEGYKQHVDMYFKECEYTGQTSWGNKTILPAYVLSNYIQYIWQRMRPEDFNNPEGFIEKQNQMLADKTLDKYYNETYLGRIQLLNGNVLCVRNDYGEKWDECDKQLDITIYDKDYYENDDMYVKPKCMLPLIRYGIYEKDGKKICYVGSIQKRTGCLNDDEYAEKTKINKTINRKKFKVNEDVPEENTEKVEPMNVLALSIFIDIMNKEGIVDYEIPCLYALDYEYHEKRSREIEDEFEKIWASKESQERNPEAYKDALEHREHNYKKQDTISEIKTERMIKNFERMLYHYKNGEILSYPGEIDHTFRIRIPKVKNNEEINGTLLKEIYDIIEEKEKKNEKEER